MINANELRIGNWVNGKDPYKDVAGYFKVENIFEDGINLWRVEGFSDEYATDVDPIPLTPEILEKAGFNLAPQRISIYLKGRVKLWLGNNGIIAYLKNEDTDESYFIPNNPKSLHQLQNLYFALTGEELDIKM